eukprot:gene3629-biopygen2171
MARLALFAIATALAAVAFAAADDDGNAYPLVYACLGITAVGAAAGFVFAYFRPVEIDVNRIQSEVMVERRPPGFLQYCMEPKAGDSVSALSSENALP